MAYATASDIQGEFKSIDFSTATAVTTAKVTEFLVQEEAYLNMRIAKRYATPITTTAESVSIMKLILTLLVKARIQDLLFVKTGDPKADQGVSGSTTRKRAEDMLTAILEGNMDLAGATLAESGGGVTDYNSDQIEADESPLPTIYRTFTRDHDEW